MLPIGIKPTIIYVVIMDFGHVHEPIAIGIHPFVPTVGHRGLGGVKHQGRKEFRRELVFRDGVHLVVKVGVSI